VSWRQATLAVWAALAAALVGCEVLARATAGRLPPVAALARRVTAPRLGRAVVILGWMWIGWHAFAR
jgi:hypothetical protein